MSNWYSVGYWTVRLLKPLRFALQGLPATLIDPHLIKKTPNKRGKGTTIVSERAYTGYCFIECEPIDWENIFLKLEKVDGLFFPGRRDKKGFPLPVLNEEVQAVQSIMRDEIVVDLTVSVGDHVLVTEGAFHGMSGVIMAVDEGRGLVTCELNIFDRQTNVELTMNSVRKE